MGVALRNTTHFPLSWDANRMNANATITLCKVADFALFIKSHRHRDYSIPLV